jgi:HK97 family phage prohead protease
MEDPIMLKSFAAAAEAGAEPGQFTALVSAFGNEDSQGDVVMPGAFTKTLAEWVLKGRPIPVVWSHQFSDPDSILGVYTAAEETDAGLRLTGQLDLAHPKAARVHSLMKQGVIVEFSISGRVRDFELVEKDDGEDSWFAPMRIKDIDLWEAGPCFKGANPETELLSVKTDGTVARGRPLRKEGRVLAARHVEALKAAHTAIGEIIAAAEPEPAAEAAEKPPAPAPAVAGKSALSPSVRALLVLTQ